MSIVTALACEVVPTCDLAEAERIGRCLHGCFRSLGVDVASRILVTACHVMVAFGIGSVLVIWSMFGRSC